MFKRALVGKLEPRFEHKYTNLIDEFDDVSEINFIHSGSVVVGFEINRVKKYSLALKAWDNEYGGKGFQYGAYETTLYQKSEFVYTCATNIEGFFIRKENWQEILSEYKEIAAMIIIKSYFDYVNKIQVKMNSIKRRAFSDMMKRADKNMSVPSFARGTAHDQIAFAMESLGITLGRNDYEKEIKEFDLVFEELAEEVKHIFSYYDAAKIIIDDKDKNINSLHRQLKFYKEFYDSNQRAIQEEEEEQLENEDNE